MALASSSGGTSSSRSRASSARMDCQSGRQPLRIHSGRHREGARIRVVDDARAHVVGQPLLLANREEEPAAHAVAEHRVEDRERPRIGVVAPERRHPDDDLRLRRLPAGNDELIPRRKCRRRIESRDLAVPAPERLVDEADQRGVREIARGGDHGVCRPVHRGPEVVDGGRGQVPDPGFVAADFPAQRPRPEHRLLEQDLAVLGRVVHVRTDLLDDHGPLVVDLALVEGGADDQLPDDLGCPLHDARRDADPVHGGLAVSGRVEAPPDALDGLGDRPRRRVPRRPLERQVLHEMRHADLAGPLEAGAGEDVCRDGDRTRRGQSGADHARPIRQRGPFEHCRDGTGTRRASRRRRRRRSDDGRYFATTLIHSFAKKTTKAPLTRYIRGWTAAAFPRTSLISTHTTNPAPIPTVML